MAMRSDLWLRLAAVCAVFMAIAVPSRAASADRAKIQEFSGPIRAVLQQSPAIDYNIELSRERFFVHVPADYTGDEPYGLIVFVDAGDQFTELPPGWGSVLRKRKLLLVAPQNAGNDQVNTRRCGLAVMAAMKMLEQYNVDPQRIYAAGFSGGARMAGLLGFLQPDLFRGTIQSCGADFYEQVEQVAPKSPDRPEGTYGDAAAVSSPEQREEAKRSVRFFLITGAKDFRHGEILDIYNGGFAKAGFQARLLDVAGMAHTICGPAPLMQAITFLDDATETSQDEPGPQRAPWALKPVAQWPLMVLSNVARLKPNVEYTGGTAFLLRLPNGVVVATTARHIVGEEATVSKLSTDLISWTMQTRTEPARGLEMQRLAMRQDSGDDVDCVMLSVPQQIEWPVEPVQARETRAEVGETVYLAGYDADGTQVLHQGKVTANLTGKFGNEFAYDLGGVQTMGYSGAPIVDESGNAVGIHLGWVTYNGTKSPRGLHIDAAAAAAEVPTPATPAVKRRPTQAPATKPAPVVTARPQLPETDPAAKAISALHMARSLVEMKNYTSARPRLKAIVTTYPGTDAAKDAAKILLEIEGL